MTKNKRKRCRGWHISLKNIKDYKTQPASRHKASSFSGILGPLEQRGQLLGGRDRLCALQHDCRIESHRLVGRLDAAEQRGRSSGTVRGLVVHIVGLKQNMFSTMSYHNTKMIRHA